MNNILIIGPGAYGLCLAEVLNKNNNVYLLGNCKVRINEIQSSQFMMFNQKIKPANNAFYDYNECFKNKYDLIIVAVPSKNLKEVVDNIAQYINYPVTIINTAKGMIDENNYWVDYFEKANHNFEYCYLAGPSFAVEVLNHKETICNLCTKDLNRFNKINAIFKSDYFKLVYKPNIKEVEFISSVKNALAICFGAINSLTNSQNTINSLFIYALNDIKKLVNERFNHQIELIDYATLGDIIMCCHSVESRNYCYGYDFVKMNQDEFKQKYNNVTIEGFRTLKFIYQYIQQKKLDCSFFKNFYEFFNNEQTNKNIINNLFKNI